LNAAATSQKVTNTRLLNLSSHPVEKMFNGVVAATTFNSCTTTAVLSKEIQHGSCIYLNNKNIKQKSHG